VDQATDMSWLRMPLYGDGRQIWAYSRAKGIRSLSWAEFRYRCDIDGTYGGKTRVRVRAGREEIE
jgi:hypothetical protein